MSRETVAVAMSGGVDSAAAALLLLEAGYNVWGVTLRLQSCPGAAEAAERELVPQPFAYKILKKLFPVRFIENFPPHISKFYQLFTSFKKNSASQFHKISGGFNFEM